MKIPAFNTQFKKDMETSAKRGKDLTQNKAVMFELICENLPPPKNKDHSLQGEYKGHRECYIEPDWLLIYKYDGDYVKFERSGMHSDLFLR
jgi:mRNA interferase YafQ